METESVTGSITKWKLRSARRLQQFCYSCVLVYFKFQAKKG